MSSLRHRLRIGPVRRRGGAAVLAFAGAIALAGCDTPRLRDDMHPLVTDPAKRHPIGIAADTATLELPPGTGEPGARSHDAVATMRFLRRFKQEARGPLVVSVPRGRDADVDRRLEDVRRIARMSGIAAERIRIREVGHSGGSVTLAYDRLAVVAPVCGDWSENVARNPENIPYPNFGCASQRNLAHMIANPTDAVFPALEAPRMSDNRAASYSLFKGASAAAAGGGGGTASGAGTATTAAAPKP